MSIAVLRSDYETNCTASTSVRFDRKEARNRQLHIFAERNMREVSFPAQKNLSTNSAGGFCEPPTP